MKVNDLILNTKAVVDLESYLKSPTQTLLLTGPVGVGLGTIARAIASQLAGSSTMVIAPSQHDKQKTFIINADDISSLGGVVRDKRTTNFVIVLDDIDQTSPGLFEHMLKLVEEPVQNLYYIFTTHNLTKIPATILSRAPTIRIPLPPASSCDKLLAGLNERQKQQIKFIAARKPATIVRLTMDEDNLNSTLEQVSQAKNFLQSGIDRRLTIIDEINDRTEAVSLVKNIATIYLAVAQTGRNPSNKFQHDMALLSDTSNRLVANGNAKIQLTNLAINL